MEKIMELCFEFLWKPSAQMIHMEYQSKFGSLVKEARQLLQMFGGACHRIQKLYNLHRVVFG